MELYNPTSSARILFSRSLIITRHFGVLDLSEYKNGIAIITAPQLHINEGEESLVEVKRILGNEGKLETQLSWFDIDPANGVPQSITEKEIVWEEGDRSAKYVRVFQNPKDNVENLSLLYGEKGVRSYKALSLSENPSYSELLFPRANLDFFGYGIVEHDSEFSRSWVRARPTFLEEGGMGLKFVETVRFGQFPREPTHLDLRPVNDHHFRYENWRSISASELGLAEQRIDWLADEFVSKSYCSEIRTTIEGIGIDS